MHQKRFMKSVSGSWSKNRKKKSKKKKKKKEKKEDIPGRNAKQIVIYIYIIFCKVLKRWGFFLLCKTFFDCLTDSLCFTNLNNLLESRDSLTSFLTVC